MIGIRLLDRVRHAIRVGQYSKSTEKAYQIVPGPVHDNVPPESAKMTTPQLN